MDNRKYVHPIRLNNLNIFILFIILVGKMKYWYARKGYYEDNELHLFFYKDDYYEFTPNNLSQWEKLARIKQDFYNTKELIDPFRVASGILLVTNDNKYVFYIRDPNSYVYPRHIQFFGGILKHREFIHRNATRSFINEVFVWDNNGPIRIKFENAWSKKDEEIFQETLKKATLLPINLPTTNKITDIIARKHFPCATEPTKIIMYVDDTETEISKGYFMYDKNTNSIEIMYVYKIDKNSSEINMISTEAISNPVIFIPQETLIAIKKSFFAPNTQIITDILDNCIEL